MKKYLLVYKNNMSTLSEVRTAIKTKLDTLTWVWQPLQVVYDYHTTETEWYPYATFEVGNLEWEFVDTCYNNRIYTFNVFIFKAIEKDTDWTPKREEARQILDDAWEQTIQAFDEDYTLGWVVEKVQAGSWPFGQIVWEAWDTLYGIFTLKTESLVKITT